MYTVHVCSCLSCVSFKNKVVILCSDTRVFTMTRVIFRITFVPLMTGMFDKVKNFTTLNVCQLHDLSAIQAQ